MTTSNRNCCCNIYLSLVSETISGVNNGNRRYVHVCMLYICIYTVLYIYWRASEASETLSGVTNGNRRLWYVQDTLVARAWCYVMWEELSANHFLNVVTTGNEH